MSEQFLSAASTFNIAIAAGAMLFALYLLTRRSKPARTDFAMVIPLFGNELHLKYRRRTRWAEDKRVVPVWRVGALVVSYWSRRTIEHQARYQD